MRETASVRETTSENEERGERATALGGERVGGGERDSKFVRGNVGRDSTEAMGDC